MISDLITTFNHHFNYLNSRQKRAGCGLFTNKELTAVLEAEARRMGVTLNGLAKDNALSEADKSQQFIDVIRDTFKSVETQRGEKGKIYQPKKYKPLNMIDINGKVSLGVFRVPYAPDKFEKKLVSGLAAVCHAIAAQNDADPDRLLPRLKDQCEQLMREIREYKAPEKYFTPMPIPGASA